MEIYYLWLAFHAGISLSIQHALLYQYGDPQTLYTASRQELSSQLKRLKSNTLMLSYDLKPANTLLQNHAHLGIKTLTCMDSRYRIKHPDYTAKKAASRIFPLQPIVLFYKGKLQPLTVPVVGVSDPGKLPITAEKQYNGFAGITAAGIGLLPVDSLQE